jgi:hypothetical protein
MINLDEVRSGNVPELIKSGDTLKFFQVFLMSRNEKSIPTFQRFILEVCAFNIAVAANGQHIGLETAAKAD